MASIIAFRKKYSIKNLAPRFDKICGQKIVGNFTNNLTVPDSIRGVLCYSNERDCWEFAELINNNRKLRGIKTNLKQIECFRKIIIILESPHRDEYDKNGKPLFPAQGKTGSKIVKNIENIEKWRGVNNSLSIKLDREKSYCVILMNPVQYAASCYKFWDTIKAKNGKVPANLTDFTHKVFEFLFLNNDLRLKEDFKERLRNLYTKGDIVINSTTEKNRSIVKNAIEEVKIEIHLTTLHPSSRKNFC